MIFFNVIEKGIIRAVTWQHNFNAQNINQKLYHHQKGIQINSFIIIYAIFFFFVSIHQKLLGGTSNVYLIWLGGQIQKTTNDVIFFFSQKTGVDFKMSSAEILPSMHLF